MESCSYRHDILILSISENASDEKCLYYAEPHPMYFMADKTAIPQPTPFLPLLFSFSTPRLKDGKGNRDVVMKIPGYDWSSPFSIDTVNLDGCVEVGKVLELDIDGLCFG